MLVLRRRITGAVLALSVLTVAGCTSGPAASGPSSSSSATTRGSSPTSVTVQVSVAPFTASLPGVATLSGTSVYVSSATGSVTLGVEKTGAPTIAGFTAAGTGVRFTLPGTGPYAPLTLSFARDPVPDGAIPVVASTSPTGGYQLAVAEASADGISVRAPAPAAYWPGWVTPDAYVAGILSTLSDTLTTSTGATGCTQHSSGSAFLSPDTTLLATCLETNGSQAEAQVTSKSQVFAELRVPGSPTAVTVDPGHRVLSAVMTRVLSRVPFIYPEYLRGAGQVVGLPPGAQVTAGYASASSPLDLKLTATVTPPAEALSDAYAVLVAAGVSQDEAMWAAVWALSSSSDSVDCNPQFPFDWLDGKDLSVLVTCAVQSLAKLPTEDGATSQAARLLLRRTPHPDITLADLEGKLSSAAAHVQVLAKALSMTPATTVQREVTQQILTSFPRSGADVPGDVHLDLAGSSGTFLYDQSGTIGVGFMSASGGIGCVMSGTDPTGRNPSNAYLFGSAPQATCSVGWAADHVSALSRSICPEDFGYSIQLKSSARLSCSVGNAGAYQRYAGSPYTWWYDPRHNPGGKADLSPYPPAMLGVGNSIRFDQFLCTSTKTGMRCTNTRTGAGFLLSRTGYRLIG